MIHSSSEKTAIAVAALIVSACGSQSNGEDYLDAALDIIEDNSIRKDEVDWEILRRDAIDQAGEVPSQSSRHESIRFVLAKLNDNHSHLLTPSNLSSMGSVTSVASSDREVQRPTSLALTDAISYVRLPSFVGRSSEQMTTFADGVQERIAAVDSDSVCGWIVDLRGNPGGNVWPVLAGVGPLMGEGVVSSYVYPDGERTSVWYRDGKAGIVRRGVFGFQSSVSQASISGEPHQLKRPDPGVAVIVGSRTGSSGELVAISFIGRSNTRTFGSETLGLTTNNDSFPLQDGSILVLATSIMADRTGHTYGSSIRPDSAIEPESVESLLSDQPVIASASQWLQNQTPCRE